MQKLDIIACLHSLQVIRMTCYFRHMKLIFEQIGVEITPENKRDIDKKIHALLGTEYKNCSSTWKAVKARLTENEEKFLADLDKALA